MAADQCQYVMLRNGRLAVCKDDVVVIYDDADKKTPLSKIDNTTTGAAPSIDQLTYGSGNTTGLYDIATEDKVWTFNKTVNSHLIYNTALDDTNILASTANHMFVLDPRINSDGAIVAEKAFGSDVIKITRIVKNGTNQGTTMVAYVTDYGISVIKFLGADIVNTHLYKHKMKDIDIVDMDVIWAGDVTYAVLLTRKTFLKNNVLLFALEGVDKITQIHTKMILESVSFVSCVETQVSKATMVGICAGNNGLRILWTLTGCSISDGDCLDTEEGGNGYKQWRCVGPDVTAMMDIDTRKIVVVYDHCN